MFNNSSFESIAKTMKESAEKFNPTAAGEALKPTMDNLKAWGTLAQKQAQLAQAAMAANLESFKSIKEPQAAFEAMKASAENGLAIATKNLQEVTALGVAQFHSTLDAIEKAHPIPEAFSNVGKGLKTAATNIEEALESAVKRGASAASTVAKKARGG